MHDFLQLRNYYGIGFAAVTVLTVSLVIWFSALETGTKREAAMEDRVILEINEGALAVEIAETPAERIRGLSGRAALAEGEGLLFVFPDAEQHGIWMKDMHFPIDILWLNERMQVVGLKRNATPESFPKVFRPDEPARYVLETNAGFIAEYGIVQGDHVRFRKQAE